MRIIHNYPVAVWKDYLILSDLHIGNPKSPDWRTIYNSIEYLLSQEGLSKVILLGDVKDSIVGWSGVSPFLKKLGNNFEVYVCKGNHDGNIEQFSEYIQIIPSSGAIIDGLGCFHGHALPDPAVIGESQFIAMGHMHPIYRENSFRSPAFVSGTINNDKPFLIFPSFTLSSGTMDFNSIPLLRTAPFTYRIYLLNGLEVGSGERNIYKKH